MAISGRQHLVIARGEEPSSNGNIAGGSANAALAALIAGVFAFFGIFGISPDEFAALSAIGVGGAIVFESGAVARHLSILTVNPAQRRAAQIISGGVMLQSMAGAAGVALGSLALAGFFPVELLGAAALAYGCGAMMESDALARLNLLLQRNLLIKDRSQAHVHEAINVTVGIDLLCGVWGVVLGALSLLGLAPVMLTLLALAGLAGGLALRGAALPAQALGAFNS